MSNRTSLPNRGQDWESLQAKMMEMSRGDADWRSARTAVYVFNAGEDVLRVAKEAYALYQSENGLGPMAFPSLKRMEQEVIDMGLDLLNGPEGACGNMTSGGSDPWSPTSRIHVSRTPRSSCSFLAWAGSPARFLIS